MYLYDVASKIKMKWSEVTHFPYSTVAILNLVESLPYVSKYVKLTQSLCLIPLMYLMEVVGTLFKVWLGSNRRPD